MYFCQCSQRQKFFLSTHKERLTLLSTHYPSRNKLCTFSLHIYLYHSHIRNVRKAEEKPWRKDSVVPAADNSNPHGEPETQSAAVAQEISSLVAEAVGEKLDAVFGKLRAILSSPKRSRQRDKQLATTLKKYRVEHPLEASQSQVDSDRSDNEEDSNAAKLSDSSDWRPCQEADAFVNLAFTTPLQMAQHTKLLQQYPKPSTDAVEGSNA